MAPLASSYDVNSGDQTVLAVSIGETDTTGIKFGTIRRNKVDERWKTLIGVVEITQELDGELKSEYMSFNGGTFDDDDYFIPADVSRDVARDGTTFIGSGIGQKFNRNANVRLVNFHANFNKKASLDKANTWTFAQTIASGIKWLFGDSNTWIYGDGVDIYFRSNSVSQKSLSQLAASSGSDEKAKASAADTTSGYLQSKIAAGSGISVSLLNPGGNEQLQISSGNFHHLIDDASATIASGAITVTQSWHDVDTEGAASQDELITINGGSDGDIIYLSPLSGSRKIILGPGGNIDVGPVAPAGYFTLDAIDQYIMLIRDGNVWHPLATSVPGIVGEGKILFGNTVPDGHVLAYGQSLSLSAYRGLFAYTGVSYGLGSAAGTFTVDAGTDIVTAAAHGLTAGTAILVTSATTLPAGLTAGTVYYLRDVTTNTFKLSTTQHGAAVDITDGGTGVHSFYTTFKAPDMRGRVGAGKDDMGGVAASRLTSAKGHDASALGGAFGAERHQLTTSEMPVHTHSLQDRGNGTPNSPGLDVTNTSGDNDDGSSVWNTVANSQITSAGGDAEHENVQPTLVVNYAIRY